MVLRQFSDLLYKLYQDTHTSSNWNAFLDSLKSITGSHSAVLYVGRPATCEIQNLVRAGVKSELSGQVYRRLINLSPFNYIPENEVISLDDLSTRRILLKSDFYRLCMLPHNIHHMLGANLYQNGEQIGYLRIIRTRDESPFSEKDKQLCSLMLPHLGNALQTWTMRKSYEVEKLFFNHVLDHLQIGKLIVNSELEIVASNKTAASLLQSNGALFSHQGHLKAAKRDEQHLLQQTIGKLLDATSKTGATNRHALAFKNNLGHLVVQALITTQSCYSSERELSEHVVVYLACMQHEVRLSGAILSELFDLTPSEASIAIALAKGKSVEEAAVAADITLNTARTHIKGAFNKLGVTQQSMLVSRVLTSVARLG